MTDPIQEAKEALEEAEALREVLVNRHCMYGGAINAVQARAAKEDVVRLRANLVALLGSQK